MYCILSVLIHPFVQMVVRRPTKLNFLCQINIIRVIAPDRCGKAIFSRLQPWTRLAWAQLRTWVRLALTSSAMKLQIWQCPPCTRISLLETDGQKLPPSCLSPGLPKTTKTWVKPPPPDRSARAATPGTKWRWCSVRSGETRAKGKSSTCWRPKLTLSADVR